MTVNENDDFTLEVTFEPEEIEKITWFCNNQLLEQNDSCHISVKNGKSIIKITNADKKKIGKYEVVLENNNIVCKSASTVKLVKETDEEIIQPPLFIKPLRPKYVDIGDIVLLETSVQSNPCASFQWFIGNKDVVSYTKENKIRNIYITNKNNISCLCIENMTRELFGIITCRAENFGGSVSCSASLLMSDHVKPALGKLPEFIVPLVSTTVMDGDQIMLKCTVLGEPWPEINWYHNDKIIEWARDVTFGRQESGLCELCIKEAFPEMSGKYSCVAINEFGSSSCECFVTVEGSETVLVICACLNLTQIL